MRPLILAPLLALLAPFALAASAAAQLSDPATGCSILNDPIEFGSYNTLAPNPRLATGRVELLCGEPVLTSATRVTLTAGQSGIPEDRVMTSGSATLHYNLYADPGRQRVVGEGPGGGVPLTPILQQTRIAPGFGQGARRGVFRIYAAIPAGQSVPAGDYTDIIHIQVEF